VIYLSDNGPNSWRWNDGMKGRKGSVDEGGVRVPFFVSWPGRIEASVIGTPAAHIDLLPTLCDLCDVPLPTKNPLDGRSLKPLMQQEDGKWTDRNLFSDWGKRVSVRAGDMRADRKGLYDLKVDPGQARNLAGSRGDLHAKLLKEVDVFLETTQPAAGPGGHHVGFPEFPLVTLNAQEAKFEGKGLKYSSIHPNASWIRNWTDPQDWPFWEIEVVKKGAFEVSLLYTCEEDAVGTRLEAAVGDQSARGEIVKAFNPPHFDHNDRVKRGESFDKPFEMMKLGVLHLEKGAGVLTLKALNKPGREVMHLRAIRLERQ
jgi:hypothetical protein